MATFLPILIGIAIETGPWLLGAPWIRWASKKTLTTNHFWRYFIPCVVCVAFSQITSILAMLWLTLYIDTWSIVFFAAAIIAFFWYSFRR